MYSPKVKVAAAKVLQTVFEEIELMDVDEIIEGFEEGDSLEVFEAINHAKVVIRWEEEVA